MNKEAEDYLTKHETCYAYNDTFKFYYKKSMPRHECEAFIESRNRCKGGHWEVRRKVDCEDHFQLMFNSKWAGDGSV
jgi:hypothetical protein